MNQEEKIYVKFHPAKDLKKLGFRWVTDVSYSSDDDESKCPIKRMGFETGLTDYNDPGFNDGGFELFSAPEIMRVVKWLEKVKGFRFYLNYHLGNIELGVKHVPNGLYSYYETIILEDYNTDELDRLRVDTGIRMLKSYESGKSNKFNI